MTAPTGRRAALGFIFVTVIVDVLAFGVTLPVLPKLVETFVGGDTADAARIFGLFGTVWALMQFLFSPILGGLSDRYGRRPVILISLFGLGLDYVLMALAPTLGWLFLGRVLSGALAANFSTAAAYVADVTPPEKRAAGYGMIGAAWGVGFVLGPALGGIMGQWHPRLPFWIAGALTLVNALYGLVILPESHPVENRRPFDLKRANPLGALGLLRSRPGLLGLGSSYFLHHVAHQVLPSVFVLFAGYRFGWNARDVGLALTAVGVATMIVQGGLVQPIVRRLGERRAMLAGLGAELVSYTLYGFAATPALLWVGIAIGAFAGLFNPAIQGLMTSRVDLTEQGRLQGANGSLMGIAGLIGPSVFGAVFAAFIEPGGRQVPGAAFFLAALFVALGALLSLGAATRPRFGDPPEAEIR
ncbi:MAG: TCR/Tet family MFS transporter [Gemmatimonadales bacterium]